MARVIDILTGLSRRLRLAMLALALVLGVKTVAAAFAPVEPPSATTSVAARDFGAAIER